MSRASVVVVGGGIAGLAAAYELSGGASGPTGSTPRVEVIEQSPHFGGSLATTTFAGRTIDLGADGILARRPEAVQLIHDLGLDGEVVSIAASGASIFARGALHELPSNLVLGVPTDLKALVRYGGLSWRGKLAARRDWLLPKRFHASSDPTIGDITRTKLGRELSYQFIEPMIGGIQAGRIDELSARSVFPLLFTAAEKNGSLMKALRSQSPAPGAPSVAVEPAFVSLASGVGGVPTALVQELRRRDVALRAHVTVTALRSTPADSYPWEIDTLHTTTSASAVVLATSANSVATLLGSRDAALEALSDVPYASAAIVTFSVPRANVRLPEQGTGVLVPLGTSWRGSGSLMVTALTFLDRKWPHLALEDDVLLRAHVGRSDDLRWMEMSDDDLITRLTDELDFVLGSFTSPTDSLVQRWPNGLPQYRSGHHVLVERARAVASSLGIALAGNSYDGVGVPASIGSGRRAAREVLARLAH